MRQARPGHERTAAPREYSASSAPAPSVAIVAAICGAEILGLAGFSIIPALLPQFIEAWSLTNTKAGWLAGITSAGYMLAVIPLVSLTDRRPARQLYLASSALSALSCLAMGLCDSLLPALGFRALAGIAMAGMYMPGLRALTHGVEGATRARISAWYTSSFTIGASLSFLFGRVGTLLGWRSAFVIAGILGAAGALIAWAALPGGDSRGENDPQPLLDFRPVLANRDVLALIIGYAAAMWGCVGLRQWIVVFLTFCAGDQAAVPAQAWIILVIGAMINFLGVPPASSATNCRSVTACARLPPWCSCSRRLPAVCSASRRCSPMSPCLGFPSLPASPCRAIFRISLRACWHLRPGVT